MKRILPILCCLLFSCATTKEPGFGIPVVSFIVEAEGFWDGGSSVIEFTDAAGGRWQLYHNLNMGERDEKKKDTLVLTRLSGDFGEPIIHSEGIKLKKESDPEIMLFKEVNKALIEGRIKKGSTTNVVEDFIRKYSLTRRLE